MSSESYATQPSAAAATYEKPAVERQQKLAEVTGQTVSGSAVP
jgi:hypothetical protein